MRLVGFSGQVAVFGLTLAVLVPFSVRPAEASARSVAAHHSSSGGHSSFSGHSVSGGHSASGRGFAGRGSHGRSYARGYGYSSGGLQCVPFARENTGIELAGNASAWWPNAEGVYERGARPEVGSVLNFRANGHMRMGHVAVVTNVENSRTVEIDHANWAGPGATRGGVSRNITVVDVSAGNDWSSVRVALGHTETFGSVYPTYGFIYDRPDKGTMVANSGSAPAPLLNAAPRDLRPASDRIQLATATQDDEEVAEASDDERPRARRVSGSHASSMHHGRAGKAVVTRVKTSGIEKKPHRHHL